MNAILKSSSRFYLGKLSLLLVIKTLSLIVVMLCAGIGLGPDEAQYWTWSQQLDWGYYSKPPAIAWQIGLGCKICGNTELGVRFVSLFMGLFLSLATYYLAIVCKLAPRTAFWSAMTMAFSPLGILGSFLAITDGGLALFWAAACIVIARALKSKTAPNYYLLGLLILCGALFKWPIYLFWIAVSVLMIFYRFIYRHAYFLGIAISLLGLLPSIIWNYSHDWGTFRHVMATVEGGHSKEIATDFFHGNLGDFFGAQAVLVSPILFGLLLAAFYTLFRKNRGIASPLMFSGGICLAFLIAYCSMALFQKVQGNWASYIYCSGMVFLCWYACEKMHKGTYWIYTGVALSLVLVSVGFAIPYIQSKSLFSFVKIPYKINPFRQNMGWDALNEHLTRAGYRSEEHFLFGDKYQMSSLLSFYGPNQKRAYFLNLHGMRHNQFSYWPGMAEEQLGKTGYFVLAENSPHLESGLAEREIFYKQKLAEYFDKVEYLGIKSLFKSYGEVAKGAMIYRCTGYNGKKTAETNKY